MKRLLVLNFFPAFVPPSSGGELRYYHLYSHLSRNFDVTLLSPTYSHHAREIVTHSDTFREHRIPKEPIHDALHAEIAKLDLAPEISALVCSLTARHPNEYHHAFLELQASADIIIHECPFMLEYDLLVGLDDRPRIYNSYNVEADLALQTWRGPAAATYLAHVADLEARLVNASAACFAVSEAEAQRFSAKYGVPVDRFSVAENGIASEEFLPRVAAPEDRPSALFFGSFHPPNIAAANFIVNELAPKLPDVDFIIAGACLPAGAPGIPNNARVLGRVDNRTRLSLFASATIALNPMFTGAGTNLKSLEFLAAGIPLVTTPLGARGLEILSGKHAIIAPPENFLSAIQALLEDAPFARALAGAGRDRIVARFSWNAIAARVAERISSLPTKRKRHKVLLLNDFSAAKPTSGGEIRINRLYSDLARSYDVTHLCLTEAAQLARHEISAGFVEFQIPKTSEHRAADLKYDWRVSARDIVAFLNAPANRMLANLTEALYSLCDVVILCHPYMVGLLRSLTGRPVIYEALNVETNLKRVLLLQHPAYLELLNSAEECERAAIAMSAKVILVADSDRAGMRNLGAINTQMHVVPNGVNVPPVPVNSGDLHHVRTAIGERPLTVFIASAHPPNVEAARYILETLAPRMPDVLFTLIGAVCEAFPFSPPANVLLLGRLDDLTKDVVIELADIALNPMLSGSGSNLKLAEYFSKSRPTITTPFGARGYDIENNEQALICPLEEFAHQIRALLADPDRRRSIGASAYAFACAHLDWSLQAQRLRAVVQALFLRRPKPQRKLLVVSYRLTQPAMGGAEAYLLELLRQLDSRGDFAIDVATTDAGSLQNQFHFSCSYEAAPTDPELVGFQNLRVLRFPLDPRDVDAHLETSRHLWTLWNEEFRRASVSHLDNLPDLLLLGGWYYPETTPDGVRVWSSPRALVRTKNVTELVLHGYSPQSNEITFAALDRTLLSIAIDGHFQIRVSTQGADLVELQLERPYSAASDARPLGVMISKILCASRERTIPLPLDLNYRDVLRKVAPSEFIQDLISVAECRPPSVDNLFQSVRGPNSKALETWLADNTATYDIVLGHSVPFKTSLMAAEAAGHAGVPLVQLPHFHIDDEFYHWKSFYDALRRADLCLTFPRIASARFFERIGAPSAYVSHGPISHGEPNTGDLRTFDRLYGSSLPFVLVLGRKHRAKRYTVTIDAVSRLNREEHRCNVVMIGADEDLERLDSSQVIYLGQREAGVVLAALRTCVCLISMSESESFGIVILEAWAQQRPVIVSDACAASLELVTEGEDGLLANPGNLHEKILTFLNAPATADQMGRNGKRRLDREFSWKSIGEEVNTLLLRLAAAHHADPHRAANGLMRPITREP